MVRTLVRRIEAVKRKLGLKRQADSRKGLTCPQAEAELRRRIESERPRPSRPDVTAEVAGERMLRHLEAVGQKATTLATYNSILHTHLMPRLGSEALGRVTADADLRGLRAKRAGKRYGRSGLFADVGCEAVSSAPDPLAAGP